MSQVGTPFWEHKNLLYWHLPGIVVFSSKFVLSLYLVFPQQVGILNVHLQNGIWE